MVSVIVNIFFNWSTFISLLFFYFLFFVIIFRFIVYIYVCVYLYMCIYTLGKTIVIHGKSFLGNSASARLLSSLFVHISYR
ncbi:unnamed protein product [Acanthoscelides obtectus]|uniref:Uncharacterized protein n=1 Tax=Acanthoscelides obtectus TaxID=200917 RepID=A0A9P0LRK4_ACAOB|nr:unnamed protein product [Acanthoscelides obtectus]CAK1626076.1 hypothetical protein AOBTE_LOCUS3586 [Acanthoscelides obtectus]